VKIEFEEARREFESKLKLSLKKNSFGKEKN
jgi:hypothetical protein